MFHYCSGIFMIWFLWEHISSSLFRFASLPRFTFSPLLRSSAGCAPFSPQALYDSLTAWDTKHLSRAGGDDGTGLSNRDTMPWREDEERRDGGMHGERARCCVRACSRHFAAWWPSVSTSSFQFSQEACNLAFQRTRGGKCTCSARLCSNLTLMSYISHV